MTHFQPFDSVEEMFKAIGDQHDLVMSQMDDRHRALMAQRKFFWVRPMPELGLWVFGDYDLDAFLELERSAGEDPEEFAYIAKHAEHNNMERGYKTGRAFSVLCPEGELGDTHVSVMLNITETAFNEAKAVNWQLPGSIGACPVLEREVRAFIEEE